RRSRAHPDRNREIPARRRHPKAARRARGSPMTDAPPDVPDGEAFAALAIALAPASPPAGLRERVLRSAADTSRFASLLDRTAEMIDLGTDAVARLVEKIDDAGAWGAGPKPARLIHLPYGPRLAGVDVGFLHLPAGTSFPHHRHLGDERALVLQ